MAKWSPGSILTTTLTTWRISLIFWPKLILPGFIDKFKYRGVFCRTLSRSRSLRVVSGAGDVVGGGVEGGGCVSVGLGAAVVRGEVTAAPLDAVDGRVMLISCRPRGPHETRSTLLLLQRKMLNRLLTHTHTRPRAAVRDRHTLTRRINSVFIAIDIQRCIAPVLSENKQMAATEMICVNARLRIWDLRVFVDYTLNCALFAYWSMCTPRIDILVISGGKRALFGKSMPVLGCHSKTTLHTQTNGFLRRAFRNGIRLS